MTNINQLTDAQLYEAYKTHADEGMRKTALVEIARRVGMERRLLEDNRKQRYTPETAVVSVFRVFRLHEM